MHTETRIWILRQAPAGNWVPDTSSSDWETVDDPELRQALLWYQEVYRDVKFAIGIITTVVLN